MHTKTAKLWKKCAAPKSQGEKRCEIQGGSQEMAMLIVAKKFKSDNSGESGAKS